MVYLLCTTVAGDLWTMSLWICNGCRWLVHILGPQWRGPRGVKVVDERKMAVTFWRFALTNSNSTMLRLTSSSTQCLGNRCQHHDWKHKEDMLWNFFAPDTKLYYWTTIPTLSLKVNCTGALQGFVIKPTNGNPLHRSKSCRRFVMHELVDLRWVRNFSCLGHSMHSNCGVVKFLSFPKHKLYYCCNPGTKLH